MERIAVVFSDGVSGSFCVDEDGTIIQAGEEIGKASDASDLSRGGTGEFFTWGSFQVVDRKKIDGRCPEM